MIVLDTGPIVALFDPADEAHQDCRARFDAARDPLLTTLPVLTEAFHILSPDSHGSDQLRLFLYRGGAQVFYGDDLSTERAFELMEQYRDHPMDLADASVVVAAETVGTRKVFTLDNRDFETYRIKRGHRHYAVEIV